MEPCKVIIVGAEPKGFISFGKIGPMQVLFIEPRPEIDTLQYVIECQKETLNSHELFMQVIKAGEDLHEEFINPKIIPRTFTITATNHMEYPKTGRENRRELRKKDRKRKNK